MKRMRGEAAEADGGGVAKRLEDPALEALQMHRCRRAAEPPRRRGERQGGWGGWAWRPGGRRSVVQFSLSRSRFSHACSPPEARSTSSAGDKGQAAIPRFRQPRGGAILRPSPTCPPGSTGPRRARLLQAIVAAQAPGPGCHPLDRLRRLHSLLADCQGRRRAASRGGGGAGRAKSEKIGAVEAGGAEATADMRDPRPTPDSSSFVFSSNTRECGCEKKERRRGRLWGEGRRHRASLAQEAQPLPPGMGERAPSKEARSSSDNGRRA